tara:strand:- start:401 stop:877 length:477 start_codon:yes stop_codon:yes gene_type:complete
MVYIGIGSNLGNRIKNIEIAKYLLGIYGVNVVKSSNYYESLSWPNEKYPKFINVVVKSNTKITPNKLITLFKLIEKKMGRIKDKKNSPRICDIDIISYNKKIVSNKLVIPHKRMHKRNFVLLPLFEIDKNWSHPKLKKNIKNLIFSLPIKDIRSIKQI